MINITEKTRRIIARDSKALLTTTKGKESIPLVTATGDGDFIYDVEGNRYIDFATYISVYNFGVNSRAEVRSAIKKQVDRMMHAAFTDFYAEQPVKFAEDLVKQFPSGFGRVFYSNSGTEANEAAIKAARYLKKKPYVIAFYNSFHGRTIGSLSLTSSKSVQRAYFGPFTGVIHAPYPYPYRCPFNHEEIECGMDSIRYIEDNILSKEVSPDEVAAVIVEPVQGEGGYVVPPKVFIKELRKLTKRHGILLISDEVQSGYMRAGKFLALDNFGVDADIYTMAKSIAAGLPMGVTVTKRSLGDLPQGAHSNTFGGNLVAIAAAQAQLDYFKRNKRKLESAASRNSKFMMKRLNEMKETYEIIGDVRGLGMMIGVEIVKDKKSKAYGVKEHDRIINEAFNNGLVLLPCGMSAIRIIPPITVSASHLNKGLDIFEKAVKSVSR